MKNKINFQAETLIVRCNSLATL